MSLWIKTSEKDKYKNEHTRDGIRLKFPKNTDKEIKRAVKEFVNWLRVQYYFPIRVPIYFKDSKFLKTRNGEKVYGLFWGPDNKKYEPYIKISIGDFEELCVKWNHDNALASILNSIIHELTYYFQWYKGKEFSNQQVYYYKDVIMDDYKDTREHP